MSKKHILILLSLLYFGQGIAQIKIPSTQPESKPPVKQTTTVKTTTTQSSYSAPVLTLKIITNTDCKFYLDGEYQGIINADDVKKTQLKKGDYMLKFVSTQNSNDYFQKLYAVTEVNKEVFYEVDLQSEIKKNAEQKEQQAKIAALKGARDIAIGNYNAGNYTKAEEGFKQLENENDPESMYYLGLIYENGYSGKKDILKAYEYYEKSHNRGYSIAMSRINELNDNEIIQLKIAETYLTKNEIAKFNSIVKPLADNGNQKAVELIGRQKYIAKDYTGATEWFMKVASKTNDTTALIMIADYYFKQKNYSIAQMYAIKGLELGCGGLIYSLSAAVNGTECSNTKCYKNGTKDLNTLIKWGEKTGIGCFLIANYYGDLGTAANDERLADGIRIAFQKIECDIPSRGACYDYYKKALYYYERSGDLGYLQGYTMLNLYYQYGWGTKVDNDKATFYLKKANGE